MEGERRSINPELWHACAGPRVSLPPIGSLVVYFPQGHSEQVAASTQKEVDGHIPNYPNLQSQLCCQLHNVTLHADPETDEVFAQLTLQPVNEQEKDSFMPPDLGMQNRQPTDFFCKALTASDTSRHGGFFVPRRAAEKVFPPLDFTKQPPAQELHAKDLHDQIWTFRHIYRGQPKRHLLTTGWSVFVSAKRLVAGDSVLFIRDEKGQLLLGIRRANRQQIVMPSSVLSSDSMHIGVLAAAAHAAATSSRFQVFYNPRASPSEFVIPLAKYRKALYGTQVSVGMRFRMVFETEESTLRRYMGTITEMGDLDPGRWPGSKWRNLEVGWDESSAGERPRRVSIWEIEPVSTPFLICPPFALRPKRPQHPTLLGDDGDMEGSMKRCLTWLRGENTSRELQSFGFQNLCGDATWMRLQRAESAQPDLYNAVAAASFQGLDASKSLVQQAQQLQFRLPQQWQQPLQQQEQKQQHIMWPQSNMHQQLIFQNQQQQQQLPLPSPPPPQTQAQAQSISLSLSQPPPSTTLPMVAQQSIPMPLPHPQLQPPLSQHQYPHHHNNQQQYQQQQQQNPNLQLHQHQHQHQHQQQHQHQHQQQQPQPLLMQPTTQVQSQPCVPQTQQQAIQITDVPAHLMQLSFSRPQASLNLPGCNLPMAMRPCAAFSDSELAFGSTSVSGSVPTLQGMLAKSPLVTFTSDDNGQVPNIARPNQTIIQQPLQQHQSQGALPVLSTLPQLETQLTGSWFSFTRETNNSESPMLSNMQIVQSDTPSTITSCSFSVPPEPLDNPLDLPSTTGSFQSRSVNVDKEVHARAMNGNMLGSFPSPSGSFTSVATDVSMNPGMMVNGGLDEALLQRNWSQMLAPVRTFTKVHKSGSVGRSIDLSRLKNYDELRRELARMFNLEGQLEDPQNSCWKLVFIDNEKDTLLVGDDPWDEFVTCVRAIKILSPAQVLQMNQEGLEQLCTFPMQQTSSSSGDCQVWKDT